MRTARLDTGAMTTADPASCVRHEQNEAPDPTALLKLLTFLSPAFPIGSFSYSHGLEWLIVDDRLRDAESIRAWLVDLLEIGSLWNDAVLLAEAHRAHADPARLLAVAELAEALAPSNERRLEAMAQGTAFLEAVAAAWPCPQALRLLAIGGAPYPVAAGACAAAHGIGLDAALPAWLNAAAATLVSVGVRLIPIGQNAGLKVLAALHPLIAATAKRATASTFDDLGSSTILADIASMRHEQQYSRVFRT